MTSAKSYPRGNGVGVRLEEEYTTLDIGRAELLCEGKDLLFICYGPMSYYGLQVARRAEDELGLSSTVVNARFAKPLDEELFAKLIPRHRLVCTLEDHFIMGGFSSVLTEFVNDQNIELQNNIKRFGVHDKFVPHASQAEQHAMHGYDPEGIFQYISQIFKPAKAVAF